MFQKHRMLFMSLIILIGTEYNGEKGLNALRPRKGAAVGL
jgi:hypothetical protein